ncbi:phosphonate ABC transporter substrate-binding protein [Oscillatoriales cyanobacterium USR001]|nr:phosphonate ABC transporter substrate-binding protein [Oscillatoriales cyanobacterium USR001]
MKRRHFVELSLLFLASCSATVNQPNNNSSSLATNEPDTLKFAVTDIQGMEDLQQNYELFRTTLQEILGKKIDFYPVDSYIAGAVAIQSGQVKLVLTGPSEYTIIRARTNAVPVVAITRPDYHSIILVPTKSEINSLEQLKGKTIAMWEIGSTGGHLGPVKILLDGGLNPQSDVKISMLGKKGLLALKNGEVDALAIGLNRYKDALANNKLSESDFRIIATGKPLPNDLFVASSDLSPDFVEKIRDRMVKNQDKLIEAILTSKANDKYKGSKLLPANDSDYDMIREVYKAIGQGKVF